MLIKSKRRTNKLTFLLLSSHILKEYDGEITSPLCGKKLKNFGLNKGGVYAKCQLV